MIDMFAFDAERFPAGRQDCHLRSFPEDALGKGCGGLDHVLAAVEDQQHPLRLENADKARGWIAGLDWNAEGRGQAARYEVKIVDRPQVEETNGAGKIGKQRMAHRRRDGRLADPAQTVDGHEPMSEQVP